MGQMHLHGENFDFCRICLLDRKSNSHLMFLPIFKSAIGDSSLKQHLKDLLGIKVSSKDTKTKMICQKCFIKVANWYEIKEKAEDSEKTINYIVSKKFKAAHKKSLNNMKLKATLTDETKLLSSKKFTWNNLFYICIIVGFFFLMLYIQTFFI